MSNRLPEQLIGKPIFTSQEAKTFGVHPSLLSYYVKKGILKRLKRGVYQSAERSSLSFQWADLIEAIYAVNGGVICLLSALAIYLHGRQEDTVHNL